MLYIQVVHAVATCGMRNVYCFNICFWYCIFIIYAILLPVIDWHCCFLYIAVPEVHTVNHVHDNCFFCISQFVPICRILCACERWHRVMSQQCFPTYLLSVQLLNRRIVFLLSLLSASDHICTESCLWRRVLLVVSNAYNPPRIVSHEFSRK